MNLLITTLFISTVILGPYPSHGSPLVSIELCEYYANSTVEIPFEVAVMCNVLADQETSRKKRE